MILTVEVQEQCKKCFHFQVCSSVLKNDLFIREVMLKEKAPKCKGFVEVVRCKDCKYAENMMPINNSDGVLMGDCTLRKEDDIIVTALGDEFCSYGERKDNDISAGKGHSGIC